ncbi:MAG: hypothetical protein J0I11_12270 [Actinobacteria bacterium]|nr:hypothetical protein [Actinomycetota bacterium]
MSMDDTTGLPRPGQSVEMHDAAGKSSFGRVQTASAAAITIAVPADAAVAVAATDGERLELRWSAGPHAGVLPVTLAARQGSIGLQVWDVTPTGPARFEQRRRQDRTAADGAITLTVYTHRDPPSASDAVMATVTGSLVDVSEAALQCLIPTDPTDAVIVSETPVLCDFSLGGSRYRLRGSVHAAWTEDARALVRVVVRFDPEQPELTALHAQLAL